MTTSAHRSQPAAASDGVSPAPALGPTIVAVGEAMIELSNNADGSLAWTFAGDSLNAAAAAAIAAPDATVRYLTGIGDDARSQQFLDCCDRLGIDATISPVSTGRHLGMYWVETDGDERWFQYWRSDSAARAVLSTGPDFPPLGPGDAVLASGITLAVAGTGADELLARLDAARQAGATVAFDTNHRPALWNDTAEARAVADQVCAIASIIVASADDLAVLWGNDPSAFCDRVGHDGNEVIVTDGPRPITARLRSGLVSAAPPTVAAVDPTGAGDAFFGTYVGARVAGATPDLAIRQALDAGARAVSAPGALGHLGHSGLLSR